MPRKPTLISLQLSTLCQIYPSKWVLTITRSKYIVSFLHGKEIVAFYPEFHIILNLNGVSNHIIIIMKLCFSQIFGVSYPPLDSM